MRPRWGAVRRVHFMGVGGVGMCALAEVLLDDGLEVSGCDSARSERTDLLSARGATIDLGHDPSHVGAVDAVVVTAAVPTDHPELAAARSAGVPIVRRAELLAEAMRGETGVAVAGTHGKTTTAALVTHVLDGVGASPTSMVGGRMGGSGGYGKRGSGGVAVCEADEFDRAFLSLDPTIAVVTNVEQDHLECYGSVEELTAAFSDFVSRVPFHGDLLLCGDDRGASKLASSARARTLTYGLGPDNGLRAVDLDFTDAHSSFSVSLNGRELGAVRLPLAGSHNVCNALAALGVGLRLGASFDDLARALSLFTGVGRRFEILGNRRGVTVVDDYAHHPTEVAAVLSAAAQNFPDRPVVAVFQPHLFSRTRDFSDDFGRALSRVDTLVVVPIFPAREAPIPGVTHDLVLDAAAAHGCSKVVDGRSVADAPGVVDSLLGPGFVLLTIGAGDVDLIGKAWIGGAV